MRGQFVIRNDETGAYVAAQGSSKSYAELKRGASRIRTFSTREQAQNEACGNESVIPVEVLLEEIFG